MDNDKRVYSGILLLPPVGKIVLKKTWQQKFCLLYKASKFGIERLEVFDGIDDANAFKSPRIITLQNCIKITQRSQTYFSLHTKTATYEFGTISAQSSLEWISAFQSVIFRDDVSRATSILEDNDLYCSSGEGIFSVKLLPSDASTRCGLEPINYTLVLTSTAIQLRSNGDNKLLYTWPYCFIRRYGHKDGKFTFEAGRKCESGEGTFFLEHSNQQEIFRCLSSKMQSMKKLLKGESHTTPPILEVGDNQLHAALSMEARTRSPLPPSPTTSTTLHDIETQFSSFSEPNSHRSALPPTIKLSRESPPSVNIKQKIMSYEYNYNSKPTDFVKQIPSKPPRKNLYVKHQDKDNNNFSDITNKQISDYEAVSKYDEVEYRSDAWRTLGTNEVNHTENQNIEDEYVSWGRKEHVIEQNLPKASKIITQVTTPDHDDSYDKLNFFGSSSKLNVNKSGYKQVIPPPINPLPCPPSYNEYDEVGNVLEGVRLADDSHLGYALIRKSPKDPSVDHKFYNNDPYAIISKPKRV